ncbi:hypothetical protein ABPG73_018937 [Tetrahymena malaccensis]
MDQNLEVINQQKRQLSSLISQQVSHEENKLQVEILGQNSYLSSQKYRFETENKPHKQHNGDIQISYQTIFGDINESFQKSFKEINNNSALGKNFQSYSQHGSYNNNLIEEQEQYLSHSKYNKLSCINNKMKSLQDLKKEVLPYQEDVKQKPKFYSQKKESSQDFEQNQQISLDSKMITPQSEFKKQFSKKDFQQEDPFKCSEIFIQDDIIYEKDLKKLGTRVNTVLKSQYLHKKETLVEQKYKQNFQIGRNIINRLLNNSMNRIMRIRQNVNAFISNLKIRHSNRRLCDLSEIEYKVINDLSHYKSLKKYSNHKKFTKFFLFNTIFKYTKKIALFMPTDNFRVIWDLVQVAFTYIFFYFYSILIFFSQNDFTVAFFDKDLIVTQRKLIVKQYLLSSIFITDFVSMSILGSKIIYSNSLASNNLNQNLFILGLNLLIFLKINGISLKKKRFDYIFTLSENQKHISKLINQLAKVITVAHIAAIGWYFLGIQEQNYGQQINWLDKIGISQDSYYQKYIYSLYWSITTMTTEQRDRDKYQEDKILSTLSNKLRDEITQEINSTILNKYLIFSSNFSKQTLNKLIFIMNEVLVNPNEIIINENQSDDSSIYFIQNGIIEIYQQKVQKQNSVNIIKTLTEGQVFGEISFFSGLQRQASARSVNLSTLYRIGRDQFIEILKENPEDFERFKMIQDQIIFQKEIQITHSECYNCKSAGHLANECPRTHKYFDKQFIILKQHFSIFQERFYKERVYFKTKKNFKNNQEIIQKLKQNFLKEDEENYLIFTKNEDFISDYTQSQYENYDEDDEYSNESDNIELSQTQMPSKFEEKTSEVALRNPKKLQQNERIEKQVKSINHVNSIATNNDDHEQFTNLENQIQSFNSNLIYENQDIIKGNLSTNNYQAYTKSFEATDNIETNYVQDPLNSSQQKSGYYIDQSKNVQKKDVQTEIQQCVLNQTDEDENSSINNSKKVDKQKVSQQNINVQLQDYLKSQMRQGPNYTNLSNQIQKQFTNQSVDDHSQNQQQETQILKTSKVENSKRKSKHNRLSKVKKESIKNNQQQNISQKELRCSVEQMLLQNLISMNLMQEQRKSQLQQKSQETNLNKFSNNNISNKSIIDNVERKSNQYIINNSGNKISQKDYSSNEQLQQQQQQQQQQTNQINKHSNENLQLLERFSKLIQESQLPLLLQLTTGKSFLQDSQFFSQNSMDFFDKMQNFKKYYPKNNFDQILHKLKTSQQEQKKQKKIKQATKERRQNIALGQLRIPIHQGNNNNILMLMQQDYDINLYKPTYLSYGTKMQKGVTFPINIISKSNN